MNNKTSSLSIFIIFTLPVFFIVTGCSEIQNFGTRNDIGLQVLYGFFNSIFLYGLGIPFLLLLIKALFSMLAMLMGKQQTKEKYRLFFQDEIKKPLIIHGIVFIAAFLLIFLVRIKSVENYLSLVAFPKEALTEIDVYLAYIMSLVLTGCIWILTWMIVISKKRSMKSYKKYVSNINKLNDNIISKGLADSGDWDLPKNCPVCDKKTAPWHFVLPKKTDEKALQNIKYINLHGIDFQKFLDNHSIPFLPVCHHCFDKNLSGEMKYAVFVLPQAATDFPKGKKAFPEWNIDAKNTEDVHKQIRDARKKDYEDWKEKITSHLPSKADIEKMPEKSYIEVILERDGNVSSRKCSACKGILTMATKRYSSCPHCSTFLEYEKELKISSFRCGECQKSLPIGFKSGNKCPYCGVFIAETKME